MPAENSEQEIKNEKKGFQRRVLIFAGVLVFVLGGGIAGISYILVTNNQVYIDQAQLEAPQVALAPTTAGILEDIFVQEGQVIPPDTVVAQVGDELIKSTDGGLVISASDDVGESVAAGTPVVTTIDPTQLRVVGQLDEDKGLDDVHVGERVVFTVDAFGGKQYDGVVSEVSPTSQESDVIFSISDQREEQIFDIKIYFDQTAYPELKNGMSARVWIYKN